MEAAVSVSRLFTEKEQSLLKDRKISRFGTVASSGWPHVVPLAYIFDGEKFFLSTDKGGFKLRNLTQNNKACLLVDDPQKPRWGILVNGQAEVMESGPEYRSAGKLLGMGEPNGEHFEFHGHIQIIIRVIPTTKVSWGVN